MRTPGRSPSGPGANPDPSGILPEPGRCLLPSESLAPAAQCQDLQGGWERSVRFVPCLTSPFPSTGASVRGNRRLRGLRA